MDPGEGEQEIEEPDHDEVGVVLRPCEIIDGQRVLDTEVQGIPEAGYIVDHLDPADQDEGSQGGQQVLDRGNAQHFFGGSRPLADGLDLLPPLDQAEYDEDAGYDAVQRQGGTAEHGPGEADRSQGQMEMVDLPLPDHTGAEQEEEARAGE